MAIDPGDSRLPLYREDKVKPVFRKLSTSKAVALHLLHRDYWEDAGKALQRGWDFSPKYHSTWHPQFEPEKHGYLEGIAHVNPWLLKFGWYLFVEVEAKYRFFRSELDSFDLEIEEQMYVARKQLNPAPCAREGRACYQNPPTDLMSYSSPLRLLYHKLGGPAGARSMEAEKLTSHGVLVGDALNNRMDRTFVPQTAATQGTDHPDHPYVTYNFPFKFYIGHGPDSLYLKSVKPSPMDYHPVPKPRNEIFMDAMYGFRNEASDSDPEAPSTSEDESEIVPRIRHPRDPIRMLRGIKPADLKMQSYKDLFHSDSYPWRPRHRKAPKSGVYWSVKVFAMESPTAKPPEEHIAKMTIRKLSYVPPMFSLHFREPDTISTDYCLAIGPEENTDGGVVTLVAKLDRVIYSPGQPVNVKIKLHNTSVRVVNHLTVEVNQCITSYSWTGRVWRNTICKRELTAENSDLQLPSLPGSENLRFQVRLNPWPLEKQYEHLFYDKMHKRRLPKLPFEEEAFTLSMPRKGGIFYAVDQPPRHGKVPDTFILKRPPAFSTLPRVLESVVSGKLSTQLEHVKESVDPAIWEGDPYLNCRCFHSPKDKNPQLRCKHGPSEEPYQIPTRGTYIYDENEDIDPQMAARNELAPRCVYCGGVWPSYEYPIYVYYEVVVSANFLPQNQPDLLTSDTLMKPFGLNLGSFAIPKDSIIGLDGPRVSLPLIFARKEPEPDKRIPVANCNIDQRDDRPPKYPAKPQLWEPSLGYGLYVKNLKKMAPCHLSGIQ